MSKNQTTDTSAEAPTAKITGLTVELNHSANPDIAGGYWEAIPPKGKKIIEIADLLEAQKVCQNFIREWGLGSGNWTGGKVKQNGKILALISYNGRIWTPQPFGHPDRKEIVLGGQESYEDMSVRLRLKGGAS